MAGLTPEEVARGRALIAGARPTPTPSHSNRKPATSLDAYIQRVVDAAPPLTAEQAERIAALLRPSAGAA